MAKKHFCKNCKKEIEEGKAVKIQRGRRWNSYYYSRYSSSRFPRETANYYLCWDCYDKEELELAKNKGDWWKWTLGMMGLVVLLLICLFLVGWWIMKQEGKWKKFPRKREGKKPIDI